MTFPPSRRTGQGDRRLRGRVLWPSALLLIAAPPLAALPAACGLLTSGHAYPRSFALPDNGFPRAVGELATHSEPMHSLGAMSGLPGGHQESDADEESDAHQTSHAHQASGVVRRGDEVLIVDDESPGGFFRYPLPVDSVMRVEPAELVWVEVSGAALAVDLEGIEVLCDGREVVLSERLRMLIASDGWVAEYDDPLGEVGERGLEGVAVRRCESGASHIAVVWEGGYMRTAELPAALARRDGEVLLGDRSARPLVFTHILAADTLSVETIADTSARYMELQTALLPGQEPAVQRFRAPDLVWHKLDDDRWGFIVLLNSSSADPVRFEYVWLRRFDQNGQPVGDPIDLSARLPPDLHGLNWEGLAWYEEGKSLLLVDDISQKRPGGPPHLVVLSLPREWRR